MNLDIKTDIVNDIGLFAYGKADWLEYTNKMDFTFMQYGALIHLCKIDDLESFKKEVFLSAIGAKTLKCLKSIIRPKTIQDTDVTYQFMLDLLEKHFYPQRDNSFYITKFQLRKQGPLETFFDYVSSLRKLMVNCNFPRKSQHSKLRNQIIVGGYEPLKKRFNPNSMSLSQVLEVGLLWDETRAIKSLPHPRNHKARKNRILKCFRCGQPKKNHHDNSCSFDWANCSSCGTKGHVALACKYKDMSCNNCGGKGHISKLCKQPAVAPVTTLMSGISIEE